MLEGLLEVVIHLEIGKIVHGDIRPIYISLEKERIILNDRLADPRNPIRIQYNHYKKRNDLY